MCRRAGGAMVKTVSEDRPCDHAAIVSAPALAVNSFLAAEMRKFLYANVPA